MDTVSTTCSSTGYDVKLLREKPLFFSSHEQKIAKLNKMMLKGSTLSEDCLTLSSNDFYRNKTSYQTTVKGNGKVALDFGFLIRDETSCLIGTIDSEKDVDFYNFTIPYNRTLQNYFNIEIHMDLPEGSDYNLTLYDEYGNQVGVAEYDKENSKVVSIPNWDTKTQKYCIKIENKDGSTVSSESYKIYCRIGKNDDVEKTDAIREAFIRCNDDYVKGRDSYETSLMEYNCLLAEAEKNYLIELEKLHERQYDSLPDNLKYNGQMSVQELLEYRANGNKLTDAESMYISIYASLRDIEEANTRANLRTDISTEFKDAVKRYNISDVNIEGMRISIASDGLVEISGDFDDTTRSIIENIINNEFKDSLYRAYLISANSINTLPSNTFDYASKVQEVNRFLEKTTGGVVTISDLYMRTNGDIGGLPVNIDKLINGSKDNISLNDKKEAMRDLINYGRNYGKDNIPEFTSSFVFENGYISTVDMGFNCDINELIAMMNKPTNSNSMYGKTYQYKFKKVL